MSRREIVTNVNTQNEAALASIKPPEEGTKKVIFVSDGDLTLRFSQTRRVYRVLRSDGTEKVEKIPSKQLIFNKRHASTDDPETITAMITHQFFGRQIFYHSYYVPDEWPVLGWPEDKPKPFWWEDRHGIAQRLSNAHKKELEEYKARMDAAVGFDKVANPENGVEPGDPTGNW